MPDTMLYAVSGQTQIGSGIQETLIQLGVCEGARDFFGRLRKKSAGLLTQVKGFWRNMAEKDTRYRVHPIESALP